MPYQYDFQNLKKKIQNHLNKIHNISHFRKINVKEKKNLNPKSKFNHFTNFRNII